MTPAERVASEADRGSRPGVVRLAHDGASVDGLAVKEQRPYVLYEATVRALPFVDRCAIAAAIGAHAITMSPYSYLTYLNSGTTTRDLLTIAADYGVEITHLDMLARWSPRWIPENYKDQYDLSVLAYDADDFFRMADALGCRSLTAVGTYPTGSMSLSETVDHFGALCLSAETRGMRVDLEFIPFWGITTLECAWDIIRETNATNSGMMFDVWHHRRSGSSDELLGSIPGHWITGVQLNDGPRERPKNLSLVAECLTRRLLPGCGEFDVGAIVAILKRTGGLNNVGVEVFSEDLEQLQPADIASRCIESLHRVLS